MKKSMIVVCGLNDNLNLEIGKWLSDLLDMFLLSLKNLMEYEIIKKNEVVEKVGIDYLQKLEYSALKKASTFENIVVVADYDNFMFKDAYKLFKEKAVVFYLKQTKLTLQKNEKEVANLNILNYTVRSKQLEKVSDVVLSIKNNDIENTKNVIIEKLKEVLL